jgi:hypothetical protein
VGHLGRGQVGLPIIDARCTGYLYPTDHGTLIEVNLQRTSSSYASLTVVGLLVLIFGLVGVGVLVTSITAMPVIPPTPPNHLPLLGPCVFVLGIIIALSALVGDIRASRENQAYLLHFVQQICSASLIDDPLPDDKRVNTVNNDRRLL